MRVCIWVQFVCYICFIGISKSSGSSQGGRNIRILDYLQTKNRTLCHKNGAFAYVRPGPRNGLPRSKLQLSPVPLKSALRVLVPLGDGCEEIEAVSLMDILRRAGVDVQTACVSEQCSRVGPYTVSGARGVVFRVDHHIDHIDTSFDGIFLPGGLLGAMRMRDNRRLKKIMVDHAKLGGLYGAICASPSIVLQGFELLSANWMKAIGYPSEKAPALPSCPRIAAPLDLAASRGGLARTVVSGQCITSVGPGSSMEFCLAIVERLVSKEVALNIQKQMLIQPFTVHYHDHLSCSDVLFEHGKC